MMKGPRINRCPQKVLYTYEDVVHGQEVTVTRYAPAEHFLIDEDEDLEAPDPEIEDLVAEYNIEVEVEDV